MLFNLLFTALPPLVIGAYDKTIPEDLLFSKPYLYQYVSTSINLKNEYNPNLEFNLSIGP